MSKVKVGMIVNYKTTEQDQIKMAEHRSVCNVMAELPAVVTAVNPESVNLKAFLDGQGEIWATSCPQGDKQGCWDFYPEDKKSKKGNAYAGDSPAVDIPAGDPPSGDQE